MRVWLSLGSNVDRERHLRSAVRSLERRFGQLTLSRVYESEAIGFSGDPFLNLVAGLHTGMAPERLVERLHAIEISEGRVRSDNRFSARTMDIDLLTYGDQVIGTQGDLLVPRDEITRHAFVLRPLSEVAGDELHPLYGKSYRQLWEAFDQTSQPLRPVNFRL